MITRQAGTPPAVQAKPSSGSDGARRRHLCWFIGPHPTSPGITFCFLRLQPPVSTLRCMTSLRTNQTHHRLPNKPNFFFRSLWAPRPGLCPLPFPRRSRDGLAPRPRLLDASTHKCSRLSPNLSVSSDGRVSHGIPSLMSLVFGALLETSKGPGPCRRLLCVPQAVSQRGRTQCPRAP